MHKNVLGPKSSLHESLITCPLFFLAGPVEGAGDWHYQAYLEIEKHLNAFYTAIPFRHKTTHQLFDKHLDTIGGLFNRQLPWERHYLEIASRRGCIIFWLPCESKTEPRRDGQYARDTRGELGEWRGRLMHDPSLSVVIGAEDGFPGLDVIRRNFSLALGYEFPIYPTLAEMVAAAVKKTGAPIDLAQIAQTPRNPLATTDNPNCERCDEITMRSGDIYKCTKCNHEMSVR